MIVYGIFEIVMGVVGYISKASVISLIAGCASGIIVIGCAALTKTNPRVGFITATVVALIVAGSMVGKTLKGVIYPSGIILVVSILFALILVGAHFAAVSKRKAAS